MDERDTVNSRRFAGAQEKLGESGEAESVRTRHRDHYNSMAALLDAPASTDHRQRVEQADQEMDDLRSAFGWSIETGDIARALELASSLMPLWLSRGRIQEGLAWFDAVLTGNASLDELAPHTRARVLADKTVLDAWVNTYNMECAGQALTIARELDDPALLARALTACCSAAVYDAEVAPQRYFAEAIGLVRTLGDQWRLSSFSVSRPRPPWSPVTTSHCGRPPRKGARSPTPSVTVRIASVRLAARDGTRSSAG